MTNPSSLTKYLINNLFFFINNNLKIINLLFTISQKITLCLIIKSLKLDSNYNYRDVD